MSGCLIPSHNRSLHCLSGRWYLTTADSQVIKSHACQEQKSPGSQLTEATSSTSETQAERDHLRAGSLEASAESAEVFSGSWFHWLSSMNIQCCLLVWFFLFFFLYASDKVRAKINTMNYSLPICYDRRIGRISRTHTGEEYEDVCTYLFLSWHE